ncbi:MAG: hypothetical protein BAA01_13585 [Bacillus thermozeamaize]|jgi:myo-inositol-1(or 4)-monophosphatase|uniref:Inositol-1-monophosphatase n=1 Tax=Bacillus thermozeamaize TaxID=230954 RepID=A0A1Y3PSC5_9BACI|nr:MAG: hypothetical protein BAA01_13585 [Bacillus thermozeamaize]
MAQISQADEQRIQWAVNRSQEAGAILMRYFRGSFSKRSKSWTLDLVTQADVEVERFFQEGLQQADPEAVLVGEEAVAEGKSPDLEEALRAGKRVWVIDPLDGTANFAHGIPFFCTSVAVFDEHGPLAGIIHQPIERETFLAVRGRGATLNGRPIRVSDALLHEGMFGYRLKIRNQREWERIREKAPRFGILRSLGAAALELAYVAAGRLVAYTERSLNLWDIAAGALLVQEAGGAVWCRHRGSGRSLQEAGWGLKGWDILAANQAAGKELAALFQWESRP